MTRALVLLLLLAAPAAAQTTLTGPKPAPTPPVVVLVPVPVPYPAAPPACRVRVKGAFGDKARVSLGLCLGRTDTTEPPRATRRLPSLGYAGPPPTRTRPPMSDADSGARRGIRRLPSRGYAAPPTARARPPLSDAELDAIIGYSSGG